MAKEAKTLWGGRFTKSPNEILWRYNASITLCKRLWRQDIIVTVQKCIKIQYKKSQEMLPRVKLLFLSAILK